MKTIDKARDRKNIYFQLLFTAFTYKLFNVKISTTDLNLSKHLDVMAISLTKVHILITKLPYKHIWVINYFIKYIRYTLHYSKATYIFLGCRRVFHV